MAIAEDTANQPAIATISGVNPVTTASFSPAAATLVVAVVCFPWATLGNTIAITFSDSLSNTWTNPVTRSCNHSAGNLAGGTIGIYYHYFASAPGSMTLTASGTNQAGGAEIATRCFTGAASSQTGAATGSAENGNPTNSTTATTSITTTTTGSIVYGMASDGNGFSGQTFTVNGSTTGINYWNTDTTDLVYSEFFKSAVTTTPGAVTLGGTWGTATQSPIAMFEVLPAAATSPVGRRLIVPQAVRRAAYY